MRPGALPFVWDGEALVPRKGFARRADAMFVIGQTYVMAEEQERSSASHRHQFAWLHEAWASLPDHLAEQFPTSETLRKHALIRTGFSLVEQQAYASNAEAMRQAATIKRYSAEYRLVTVNGNVVTVHTAKSQSIAAMGAKEFQASKTAILDFIADMIGVTPGTLAQQGEAA